ncbi:hypothetical protein HC891_17335 [Candidatus Gracilibacteria bacterium]|nr:hypothetical protein [Candidatus Gracilibacteria bacterium]
MSESPSPRDASNWARKTVALKVGSTPPEALNLNVDGRQVVGPLQGFGQLWQKTYRVQLRGCAASPEEVIAVWKAHFPEFQPPQNRFFPSVAGVAPGEVVLINAALQGMPISTGVLVLYADEVSFTLMTPEGHPESGWVTFSAWHENGCTVCQVQSMARANDPIYEIGFVLGGGAAQEAIWRHVLTSLAAHHGVIDQPVQFEKQCVDRRLQWGQAQNIWQNAAIRSLLYALARPFSK